jgi:phage/plasmid-associated DNA primase
MENFTFMKLQELVSSTFDAHVSKLIVDQVNSHIKKGADGLYYVWCPKTSLFRKVDEQNVVYTISNLFASSVQALSDNEKTILQFNKKYLSYCSFSRYRALLDGINTLLLDPNFNVDTRRDVMNFSNGVLCLRTGKFRPRDFSDKFSECLPFEYEPKVSTKAVEEINSIFFNIFNSDKEFFEFNMDWLGYCLTGETDLQQLLMYIGQSASNGKSTTMEILARVFSIYVKKLNKKAFEEKSQNKHKYIVECKNPVRLVYCEELSSDLLDSDAIKDFVCGKINTEVLYSNTTTFDSHCKLMTTGNRDSNFKNDGGMERRVIACNLRNRFIPKAEYDLEKKKNTKNIFLRDNSLLSKFSTDEYKNALVHIILQRAMKYYKHGLSIPASVELSSKELCASNDPMKEFITSQLVITHDDADKVNKDEFLRAFHDHSQLRHYLWKNVLEEAKRCKLTYNRELRYNGTKGCFTGVRFFDEELDAKPIVQEKPKAVPIVEAVEHKKIKVVKSKSSHQKGFLTSGESPKLEPKEETESKPIFEEPDDKDVDFVLSLV